MFTRYRNYLRLIVLMSTKTHDSPFPVSEEYVLANDIEDEFGLLEYLLGILNMVTPEMQKNIPTVPIPGWELLQVFISFVLLVVAYMFYTFYA